jgi:hypothetical protein
MWLTSEILFRDLDVCYLNKGKRLDRYIATGARDSDALFESIEACHAVFVVGIVESTSEPRNPNAGDAGGLAYTSSFP